MDEPNRSHRTRSKAAPDWTVEESIVLVNEINAVESEWGGTLPSFQRWQQIVENCNAIDVNRNLNQCKRQWDTLLGDYRRIKDGSGANGSFPNELFDAVDRCVGVTAGGKKYGGASGAEVSGAEGEEEMGMYTEPEFDPEEQDRVTEVLLETGSKKQKCRMKRKKRRVERPKPWGYFTSPMIKHQESTTSNIHEKLRNVNKNVPDEKIVDKEKIMAATILWENALQINTILEPDDMKNVEAVETDFTRLQGDKLIDCLGKISATLNQLCDLVREH